MKPVLRGLFIITAVLLALGIAMGTIVSWLSTDKRESASRELERNWKRWEPEIQKDLALWKDHELFQPRDGGDASKVFFEHVRWSGFDAGLPPAVPDDVSKALHDWNSEWAKHAGPDAGVEHVDVRWLAELEPFGYLDFEPVGGPPDSFGYDPASEPIPNLVDATNVVKVRLMQGLADGTHVQAAREVRQLVRLLLTSEGLVAEMVAVSFLGLERRAYDEAVARGLDVTGWEPVTPEDKQALRRLLWALKGPEQVLATPELMRFPLPIGRCSALNEGMWMAHMLRGYLEPDLKERYATYTRHLDESGCRLRRLRAAWTTRSKNGQIPVNSKALCASNPSTCSWPEVPMVGPVRTYVGSAAVTSGMMDVLKPYHSPPSP